MPSFLGLAIFSHFEFYEFYWYNINKLTLKIIELFLVMLFRWFKFREAVFSSPAKRDRITLACLVLSGLINLSLWAVLLSNFWQSSEYIVTRYNIYFGISALSQWWVILLMPLLGLLVILLNFSLSFYLYLRYQFLSYFLAGGALTFNILMAVAGALLVYANL